ncbi:MAG: tRNA (adenosine(37)-N6)-threonylcarbamoyltransferase complex transferase subunit TsaD [Candidatus Omnitrophica bacterium]|nr:tRNA (adenosine(37)-N6)-threonylcarbamoyltransferase complex transferase subunit TsaD [Candidatus Omnitrophota bacterium]
MTKLTLGIETSCDETGVAVTSGRRVLSNVVTSSLHLHKKYGGVVPEIASRYHVEYIVEVVKEALKAAGKNISDIELVAVTNGPGLVGALLTGISFAKALSYGRRIPVIGVNHVLAHLYSAFLNEGEVPRFPFVGLVVSGGHTALFHCKDVDRKSLLGQTQDDAVGEAYDKVAKILGLGYPGGPIVERTARMSNGSSGINFPKSYLGKDSLDFSFSGIKTAVLYYVRESPVKSVPDVCHAFQEAVLDVLVEKTIAACARTKSASVVVGGGVAANKRLRSKLIEAGSFNGFKVFFPEFRYCLDNGAMIGVMGGELYKRGHRSDLHLNAEPNLKA